MQDQQEFKFTPAQGRYLSFIYYYTKLHRRPPTERDMQDYFQVESSSVHQMVKTLTKNGLVRRVPGQARSITVQVPRSQLPDLE